MTKAEIRQKIWQTMQREGVARFPGAVGRVPNFAGSDQAAQLLREMAVWRRALVVKVNPDAPQLAVGMLLNGPPPGLATKRCSVKTAPRRLAQRRPHAADTTAPCRWGRAVSP